MNETDHPQRHFRSETFTKPRHTAKTAASNRPTPAWRSSASPARDAERYGGISFSATRCNAAQHTSKQLP